MSSHSLAAALLAACCLIHPARAAGVPTAELQMAEQAQAFREAADRFIAAAQAGDLPATRGQLSQALAERMGDALLRRVLAEQILPFFANGAGLAGSATITRTTDASGQQGFAFYLWLMQRGGDAPRPFTVYVVNEGGRAVIANIVPNRLVPERHR